MKGSLALDYYISLCFIFKLKPSLIIGTLVNFW